jgi:hypothetical protein
MNRDEARVMFWQTLMNRVREDPYPSATHMSILEEALPAELLPDYIGVLLEKVAEDQHPSIPMLRRIARLADAAR